ncbi:hypothetical protein Tco_0588255 [Tanacetum coccineum]
MAPDHSSLGPVLHEMMSDQIRSDLTPNRQEPSVDNISSDLDELTSSTDHRKEQKKRRKVQTVIAKNKQLLVVKAMLRQRAIPGRQMSYPKRKSGVLCVTFSVRYSYHRRRDICHLCQSQGVLKAVDIFDQRGNIGMISMLKSSDSHVSDSKEKCTFGTCCLSVAGPVTTAGEVVTTANVEVTTANAPTTTIDELTLAQTLIEIKAAKPKAVTSAATTTTTTRPKARGVVVQEPSEFKTTSSSLQASQLPQAKDKGKAKMVEPEKPLKKKDQIAMDEEVARNLEAQLQAELEEEERISRLKEEKANIALLESWDNTQAMMDADFQLAQQMQTEEQEQLSIEEKSKLFVELLEKRKKHFAALRAQEKRSKPPTKAQKRNTMSTYLKNMAGYKHNQLKSKSYDEIQEMFDKEMKRVNTFVDMNTKLVKISETRTEGSSKRAGDELESDNSKKQKIDEHVEAKKDDDQEEAEMKKHIEIVKDDEVAIDAIPLATKPPVIVKYKIVKEGKFVYFQLIRANGSSKRYLSMIKMLQNIDREDLETLWKLVKAKHGNTRPEEDYERVLWGDLKVMFEPDIKSEVWRNLQGYKVTIWKLFDTCRVHFVRFKNLHIFMLVEKRYPLTPITITNMLNKKLQADHWNEMCYQLLKLMTKQEKGQ